MKRLLLITHAFPPAPSPGALRPGYVARYLPRYGWEVTVLTKQAVKPPFEARVIGITDTENTMEQRLRSRMGADPHTPLRTALRTVKDTLLFPDPTVPWVPAALRCGKKLLQHERFDAVFSTALPTSAHVVGWMLANNAGLPWIADYRDPWSSNAYMPWGPVKRGLERAFERRIMRRAQAITTISDDIAVELAQLHRRPVSVIPNAYDPADWLQTPLVEPQRFELTYTGSMYDGKRSPELLFSAIARLREAKADAGLAARVHFYGPNSERVTQLAAQYGLSLVVRQHGTVPRAESLAAQRAASTLLIFLNMDPKTERELGSKYLEYLGAGRPILAFGPERSALRTLIESHDLGWFASTEAQAAEAIEHAYRAFLEGRHTVRVDAAAFPDATALAGRFADVLNAVTGSPGTACGAGVVPAAAQGAR